MTQIITPLSWRERVSHWINPDIALSAVEEEAEEEGYDEGPIAAPYRGGADVDYQWVLDPRSTWAQILDFEAGTDGFDGALPTITRDLAITYTALSRCTTLISGVVAQLITNGLIQIIDRDGKRRSSRRSDRILDILMSSIDGGATHAHSFFEDAAADYCLDGNALLVPSFDSSGMLTRFRRFSPTDADTHYGPSGEVIYQLTTVDAPYARETFDARDVCHVKFPQLRRYDYSTRATKRGFAVAPITQMNPALGIGLQGDRYILNWFGRGSKSKLHFDLDTKIPGAKGRLSKEARLALIQGILQQTATGQPVITQQMSSHRIDDTPQDEQAAQLRENQINEIARNYGIPGPLVGVMVTQWGGGIEHLVKIFWKFGARQHLDRFLSAMQLRLLKTGDRFLVDTHDLLRGDADSVAALLTALQGDAQREPTATREERRRIAGLSRDPDGEFPEWNPPNDSSNSGDGNDGGGDGQEEGDDGGDNGEPSSTSPSDPPPPPPPPKPFYVADKDRPMKEVRCKGCDRLLARTRRLITTEFKCDRCGKIDTFTV